MKIVKSSCGGKKRVLTCTFSPQVNIKNKREPIQTQEDVNAAYSEAKIQDLTEDLKTVIWTKVKEVATSDTWGWDDDNVGEDFFVNVTSTEIGEDHQEAVRIEVRAEVDYEGLEELMEALNPIVESYDSYAYFEPVTSGIIEAYVSVDQVDMSVYGGSEYANSSQSEYTNRAVLRYKNKSFTIYDNSDSINLPSDADLEALRKWKAQITQQAGAYNDADEDYEWASLSNGVVSYYRRGKLVDKSYYMSPSDWDVETLGEWSELVINDVIENLYEANRDVPDHMVYNSTDIEAAFNSYSIMFEGNNYEYMTNNDGFWIYRAVIDGKDFWRAMRSVSDKSQFSKLSFPISYEEAIGLDVIWEPSYICRRRFDDNYTSAYIDFKERYPQVEVHEIPDDPGSNEFKTCFEICDTNSGNCGKLYLHTEDEFVDSDYILRSFEETAEAIGLLEDNAVYSSVESSDYESDSGIFIEDIIDSLEDNGYDLSRIRSIRQGLLALFGYKGKDADIIIHDLVAGGFIDPNDWVDKDYTPGIYSATNDGEGYWFFTTHGVQPGSVPRDVDILDIIDTPNGSFVKFNRFLSTKELNEYDMKERAPKSVMSAEAEELRAEDNPWIQEIDWVMSELPSWFDVNGSNLEYDVTYDDQTVHVEFFLFDGAKYTYYIDGHGPYTTNQSERIGSDIEDYINRNFEDVTSSNDIEDADSEEDLPMVDQEYDSAATSINSSKLPAIYKMINLEPGGLYVDFGGGRWNNAVEYIKDKGATLVVYDPYNRSAEHNREVLRILRENGGADAAVNSNVLNVIKEPEARKNVLENIARITKPGAPIYITVYEGKGDGQEGPTKSGYQLNRKTADYLEEIQEVFPDATRRGKLITAHNSGVSAATNTANIGARITCSDEYDTTWIKLAKKQVPDSDGFYTDYTMYVSDDGTSYIFMFGDEDIYGPDPQYADYECSDWDEASEWWDDYNGFEDDNSLNDIQSSSSTDVTTSTVLDMNPEFRNNFEEAVDFFYEDYPATVELTDEVDEDYDTLYKAYVNETGSLYQQTPGIVYIDINWDSGEILQALQETAEAIGIEQYPDNIESSESVEGDAFSQLEDQYLSPPEYDDPIEHEDSQELIEVELDQVITVDVDGDYEWDDDTYVWASPDGSNEEWRSDDGVFIDDKVGVVEHIDGLIIPNVPVRPGKYRVIGLAELVYDVSGIQEYRTNYGPDDYESDLDIDHAVVSFNFRKSEVKNLKIRPVRR